MRLGHAQWWDELLVSSLVQIPYLRNPLLHVVLRVRALDDAGLLGRGGAADGPAPVRVVPGVVRPDVASGTTS
jgi:hypothetical protein